MRFALFALLLPFAAHAADTPQAEALRELDREVWTPFVEGVANYDDAGYLATRSRDFVMVDGRGGNFLDYDYYAEDSAQAMRQLREAGVTMTADVRFESRRSDGEYASEQGILRIARTDADGKQVTGLTRFHAISRKEDGRWRVLTEHRWPDRSLDAAAFDKAHPRGAVEVFEPQPKPAANPPQG
jgi:ketosteroid isomerase-like protein